MPPPPIYITQICSHFSISSSRQSLISSRALSFLEMSSKMSIFAPGCYLLEGFQIALSCSSTWVDFFSVLWFGSVFPPVPPGSCVKYFLSSCGAGWWGCGTLGRGWRKRVTGGRLLKVRAWSLVPVPVHTAWSSVLWGTSACILLLLWTPHCFPQDDGPESFQTGKQTFSPWGCFCQVFWPQWWKVTSTLSSCVWLCECATLNQLRGMWTVSTNCHIQSLYAFGWVCVGVSSLG